MRAHPPVVLALMVVFVGVLRSQSQTGPDAPPWFSDVFPPEEYATRRSALMQQIGDGIAVLQGAAEKPAEAPFRQNNQFFYLTGVEVPRALLLVDGRAKRSTLYLPDSSRRARAMGPMLQPGTDAARITGIESVVAREEFDSAALAAGQHGRT